MPTRPVVLTNPAAGTGSCSPDEVAEAFATLADVRPMGDDLTDDVAAAVEEGAPWVGVSGGDGSLRSAATVLVEAGVPLLTVPGGTKNHFAKALGIDTLDDAVAAAGHATIRRVDLGCVNGETFLNTASLGTYAAIVGERDRRSGWPKRAADALGAAREALAGHRITIEVEDGAEGAPDLRGQHRAWVLFVGNGDHGDGLGDVGGTRDVADGVLDVRLVRGDRRLARLRLLGAVLTGRVRETPVVDGWSPRAFTVRVLGERRPLIALDGDATELAGPLRFEVRAGALQVLVPPGLAGVLRSPVSGD